MLAPENQLNHMAMFHYTVVVKRRLKILTYIRMFVDLC